MSPAEVQVSSGLPQGQGLWLQLIWVTQPVAQALLEEGAISPTIDLLSRCPKTAEQLYYQRNSHTVKKVLGPTTDFPTWGFGKGTENLQGI